MDGKQDQCHVCVLLSCSVCIGRVYFVFTDIIIPLKPTILFQLQSTPPGLVYFLYGGITHMIWMQFENGSLFDRTLCIKW